MSVGEFTTPDLPSVMVPRFRHDTRRKRRLGVKSLYQYRKQCNVFRFRNYCYRVLTGIILSLARQRPMPELLLIIPLKGC